MALDSRTKLCKENQLKTSHPGSGRDLFLSVFVLIRVGLRDHLAILELRLFALVPVHSDHLFVEISEAPKGFIKP